jgi:hypothetical protein
MWPQQRPISFGGAIFLAGFLVLGAFTLAAPVAAQQDDSITIPLNEYENSGISGTATLEPIGNDTRVAMELSGDQLTGNHPTHIHTGTCANFDPDPTYPLTTVILEEVSDVGVSETTVEGVRLRDLLHDDYVILVHKSPEELTNYFVCGDIKDSARRDQVPQTDATPQVGASVNQVARAGIGAPDSIVWWPTLLGALAVVSASCSVALLFKHRLHR